MYLLHLTIDGLPKTANALLRRHWTVVKREKDKWLKLISLHSAGRRPPSPLTAADIKIIRHSSKPPDFDGMVASGKFLIDPLVKLGILADDNMEIIGQPLYVWQRAKSKKGFVEIFVGERGALQIQE